MTDKFKVGDLVQFDISNKYGIVIEIKNASEFEPSERIADVKVRWFDGEEFWCLDFILQHIPKKTTN